MKRFTAEDIKNELSKYKHITTGKVRFNEVDSFRVVHNIQYFYFLEWARTLYFEAIGMTLDRNTFTTNDPVMTVHHEMDYFNPLYFTDEYKMFTRTKQIGYSSVIMENIIQRNNGDICVKASATLVFMSNIEYKPTRIPDNYRENIIKLEGDNLEIIQK
jgi:YbgC/YbaW family acyl-CoA thioester hydrolase